MMTLAPNLFQGHVNNELNAQRVDGTKKCRKNVLLTRHLSTFAKGATVGMTTVTCTRNTD